MLHATTPAAHKRAAFRAGLASGKLLRFPGAFSPLSAMLIARHGFECVYVSGAVIAADLGLPDIGPTTLTEVAGRAQQIARVTDLPTLVDADTGFGEPMNAARTGQLLEDAGAAGIHVEDQVNPKRCGRLDGKDVTDPGTAVRRIKAAVAARRDPAFVIAARTDAAAVHGIGDAIDRARAYADAGADLIFPEAMAGEADIERFRAALDVPIQATTRPGQVLGLHFFNPAPVQKLVELIPSILTTRTLLTRPARSSQDLSARRRSPPRTEQDSSRTYCSCPICCRPSGCWKPGM
jgi:methylisocitrate lyase